MNDTRSFELQALGIRYASDGTVTVTGPDGIDATYSIRERRPSKTRASAVLFDLDGTSLRSEAFWVKMLEKTVRTVGGSDFKFEDSEHMLVQGASTRQHLDYLRRHHKLGVSLQGTVAVYNEIVDELFFARPIDELAMELHLQDGFVEVRAALEERGIPFVLVTNGNRGKARVEMKIIAHHLGLNDARDVCTNVWCAPERSGWIRGFGAGVGKPHPWPYLEAATSGAGIALEHLTSVIGVDDSAAGVCSIRLAGIHTLGLAGGNIRATGAEVFCDEIIETLHDVLRFL